MGRLIFGKRDNIQMIQDVSLSGPEGEDLYLGYKTSGYFVGAGIYLSDDGYVLGIHGREDMYFPMPSHERVVELQDAGVLPDPLPGYSVSAGEYAFGYSLWIIILGIIGYELLKKRFRRKKTIPEQADKI